MFSLTLGPVALSLELLAIYAALFVAWLVTFFSARQKENSAADALFYVFLWGALGARLAFVWHYWPQYQTSVWRVLDIRDGGFLWLGALIFALLALGFYCYRFPAVRRTLAQGVSVGAVAAAVLLWSLAQWQRTLALPDLIFISAQGEKMQLSQLKGQPIVVNMWASWCSPCQREMPVLAKAQQDYPKVHWVFINQGESLAVAQQFLQKKSLELQHLWLDTDGKLGQSLDSYGLPITLFFDAQGQLQASHLGELSAASLQHKLSLVL